MPSVGPTELVIVLVLAVLILGPKRLPEAGRAMGQGLRNFRHGVRGGSARRLERGARD
jgi:sec-independent protein translocase protein TatA